MFRRKGGLRHRVGNLAPGMKEINPGPRKRLLGENLFGDQRPLLHLRAGAQRRSCRRRKRTRRSSPDEQKARESALQYESIEVLNEREREMVKIVRECITESARGNIMTHMARLVQLRAYGNHNGDHTGLQTITAFKNVFC